MTIDPLLFLGLIIVIFVLGLTLAGVVYSYTNTLKELEDSKKEQDNLRENANRKAAAILTHARDKAAEIMNEAAEKVKQILSDTEVLNEESKNLLKTQLISASQAQIAEMKATSQKLLEDYNEELDDLRKEDIDLFKNISKDIEKDALDEERNFKEILRAETLDSQKIISKKIEEDFVQVQAEIKIYKEAELKKVDDSIYKVISAVSKIVIGEAISLEKHQDLVMEALKKAKADISATKT